MNKIKIILLLILVIISVANAQFKGKLSNEINYQTGNVEYAAYLGKINIVRKDSLIEYSLNAQFAYSEQESKKKQNSKIVSLNVDFLPNDVWSPFLITKLESFYEKHINLRQQYGLGIKYTLLNALENKFSISLATLYDNTKFGLSDIKSPETAKLSVRVKGSNNFDNKLKITYLSFYQPSINDFQDYTINSNVTLELPISSVISISTTVSDIYDNIVPAGYKQNDLLLYLGFTVSF